MNEELLKSNRTLKEDSTIETKNTQRLPNKVSTLKKQDTFIKSEPSKQSSEGDFWIHGSETSQGRPLKQQKGSDTFSKFKTQQMSINSGDSP